MFNKKVLNEINNKLDSIMKRQDSRYELQQKLTQTEPSAFSFQVAVQSLKNEIELLRQENEKLKKNIPYSSQLKLLSYNELYRIAVEGCGISKETINEERYDKAELIREICRVKEKLEKL